MGQKTMSTSIFLRFARAGTTQQRPLFWRMDQFLPGMASGAAANTGEVCFNTSMTGYQEILTDPSYAGQISTFLFRILGMSALMIRILKRRTGGPRDDRSSARYQSSKLAGNQRSEVVKEQSAWH